MKKSTLYWLKVAIPVTAVFCTWGGQAAMEVQGFGLSEPVAVRDVYGACHRLEEPLAIKFRQHSNWVIGDNGWRYIIKFKFAEEKKYVTDFFSADFDNKATGEKGDPVIATGPNTSYVGIKDGMHTVNVYTHLSGGGNTTHFINIPTRNLSYLSIRAHSPSNDKNEATFVWDLRDGNNISGGWLGNVPKYVTWLGFKEDNQGEFNLLNADHLEFEFVQLGNDAPKWKFWHAKMNFVEGRGPFTVKQYVDACQ